MTIMDDLALAAAGLAGLALVSFSIGLQTSTRWPARRTAALAIIVLAALLVFLFRYHGTWQIARVLPYSGAIVLGNWIPVGAAFFAGIMLGQRETPRWRRYCLACLILLASSYSVACSFLGHLPVRHRFSRQYTATEQGRQSSCGACCAANLLQHHGIDANEDELVGLCLTSYRGSPALGLYRGLKRKTADTDWDVEVVTCTADELIRTRGPLLIRVWIPTILRLDHRGLSPEFGRRAQHAVLLMDAHDDDHIQILDPAVPDDRRRNWDIARLRGCWPGEALRLVRRAK